MSKWHSLLGVAAFSVFSAAPADAQTPQGAGAQKAPSAPGAPAQAAGAQKAPSAPGTPAEPALPEVDDPMLAPPPPAQQTLNNWQEALATLRNNSTSLKVAKARIEQVRAQERVTLAPAMPTLRGVGSATDHLIRGERVAFDAMGNVSNRPAPTPGFYWTAALQLVVPIIRSRTWYDHGTAKEATESATLDAKEIERQQVGLAAQAIVAVVTSERLAEVTRVSLKGALSNLDLNRRRAALGASSTIDVLRVEQEVSLARAQVIVADETLMRAREQLGNVLGLPQSWGVAAGIELNQLGAEARKTCTQAAGVDLRPDVLAATQQTRVAERNVKSVNHAFVPTLDGTSALTYYSDTLIAPTNLHTSWTIGATLSWDIYDGGLRYGQRDARRADLELARQNVNDTRRRALIEVTQALRGVQVAQANLEVSTKGRDIASETARLTRIAYINGTGTSFDLVDTARRLREAELDLTIKEFELTRAKITAFLSLATCNV